MKIDYTDITVLLDKSGSMHSVAADTIGSYNVFVEDQTKLESECTITLVQFATDTEKSYDMANVKDIKPLVLNESYHPDGHSTSLLDSIGKTIKEVGAKYANMLESERPEKVVFVILTDGQENSSREFTRSAIFEMISHQEKNYKWEFIFMGANQDAIATGAQLGIRADNSLSVAYSSAGMSMANEALSKKIGGYRSMGFMPSFSSEDRLSQKEEGAL